MKLHFIKYAKHNEEDALSQGHEKSRFGSLINCLFINFYDPTINCYCYGPLENKDIWDNVCTLIYLGIMKKSEHKMIVFFFTVIKSTIDISTKMSEINTEKAFSRKDNSKFERRYILEDVKKEWHKYNECE